MTPNCPEDLQYLWARYCDIKRGQAITWCEIKAWTDLTGIPLTGWEAETIMRIESAVTRALSNDNAG